MSRKVTKTRLQSRANDCSYSGMVFRSHLEAKWALIFDILGWDVDYEPGTYRITPTMAYVPDFYVHPLRMWAEVKGPPFLSRESIAKICASVAGNNRLPIRSEPFTKSEGILVLGDIIPVAPGELPVVSLIRDLGGGKAGIMDASFNAKGRIRTHGDVWHVFDGSGRVAPKRPGKNLADRICNPPKRRGDCSRALNFAYKAASSLRFDTSGYALVPPQVASLTASRWAGRPVASRR